MIKVDNLSYNIGNSEILRDISLSLPKGGITALIGPNGAGKSSLLSHIARLVPTKSGEIFVDEMNVRTCDTAELAKKLAILPQMNDAAPRLSVRDLVSFGRYPHSKGRLTKTDRDHINAALTAFDLDKMENRPLDALSGGQRQKALLAMIFAQGTDYLLLDEPLNNLDIAGARGLMAQLQRTASNENRTIVIVLHDINYALAYADHVVVMAEGQIIAEGAPQTIITEELIQNTYGTDSALIEASGRKIVDVGPTKLRLADAH